MTQHILVAAFIAGVSLLYATAGQAGGTAFVAVMALVSFPAAEMRPTALLLNVIAAGYATFQLFRSGRLDLRALTILTPPSIAAAFVGGLLVLNAQIYFSVTGLALLVACFLLIFKRRSDFVETRAMPGLPAAAAGTACGLLSGLTGVGGGVFLAPILFALGWTSAKRAASISPPFILCNSATGLAGVLFAGQRPASEASLYAIGALAGAALGSAIAARWMSERATRYVLAAILLFGGLRLLLP
jgi:uncharacterized protein